MRFPNPSTLGRGILQTGTTPEASLLVTPNYLLPPGQPRIIDQPTLPPHLSPTMSAALPQYNPAQLESPTQHARRFDDVFYGDAPTRISEETTRFVLNNPNGGTPDRLYEPLTKYLMELLEIGVDVIQLPESNVD
jgi:hypothetical protein